MITENIEIHTSSDGDDDDNDDDDKSYEKDSEQKQSEYFISGSVAHTNFILVFPCNWAKVVENTAPWGASR